MVLKFLHILCAAIGLAAAATAEREGFIAPRAALSLVGIAVAIRTFNRDKTPPSILLLPWILLGLSGIMPFLPGHGGAYPATRFLVVLAAAASLSVPAGRSHARFSPWLFPLLAAWIALLAVRVSEIQARLGYGYDLAHVLNILENTVEGRFLFSDYTNGSILNHHLFLSLAILAPLYKMVRDPLAFQWLQVLLLGASVALTAWAARHRYGNRGATAAFLVFLLHPAFQGQALHEFDPGILGTFGVAIALLGWSRSSNRLLAAGAILAVLSKEHFAAAAVIAGILLLFARETRRTGIPLVLLGAAGLALWLACGFLLEGPFNLRTAFAIRLGIETGPVPAAPVVPFLSLGKIGYLLHLLLPSGGLALAGGVFLLPTLPEILINLLSRFPMYYLSNHYAVLSLPFLSLAAAAAVCRLGAGSHAAARHIPSFVGLCALLSAVFSNIGPVSHTGAFYDVIAETRPREPERVRALIARLPDGEVAVMGWHRTLTLLPHRNPVTPLPYIELTDPVEARPIWIVDHADIAIPEDRLLYDSEGELRVYVRMPSAQ